MGAMLVPSQWGTTAPFHSSPQNTTAQRNPHCRAGDPLLCLAQSGQAKYGHTIPLPVLDFEVGRASNLASEKLSTLLGALRVVSSCLSRRNQNRCSILLSLDMMWL